MWSLLSREPPINTGFVETWRVLTEHEIHLALSCLHMGLISSVNHIRFKFLRLRRTLCLFTTMLRQVGATCGARRSNRLYTQKPMRLPWHNILGPAALLATYAPSDGMLRTPIVHAWAFESTNKLLVMGLPLFLCSNRRAYPFGTIHLDNHRAEGFTQNHDNSIDQGVSEPFRVGFPDRK